MTNDQGNTGVGGPISDTDNVDITVDAVNDAPVNSVPGPQSTNEDTTLVFSSAVGNTISISDVDVAGSPLEVTLTATNGTISLAGLTGLSFTAGDGVADATMTFTGTLADLNAALDGLTFAPTADFNGAASLQITTNDQGNTGSGGAQSDTDTINIMVNPVNDAPLVNTSGGSANYIENIPAIVDPALTISDIDDTHLESATVTITGNFVAGQDTLLFTDQSGITGNWSAPTGVLTLTGTATVAQYQAALRSVQYNNLSDDPNTATRTIAFVVNDGGLDSLAATRNVTVQAVNDAPIHSIPGAQTTNEDTILVFSTAGGNLISISDVDAAGSPLQVTLTATNGTISLSQTTGLSFTAGDGVADAVMTFTGTLADLNAALDGLNFAPTANFNGAASLQIVTSDQGNTGSGGPQSDSDTINITVNAVNDAPVNAVPGPQTTNEDTTLVFSSAGGNRISISDVDAAGNPLQVTLTATNGTITLSQTNGLSFTVGSGVADTTMTFTGTLADLNAALDGLSFLSAANFNGAASLQITTNDQGNTGLAGPLSDTDTVIITVNAVNDAPVNSVPGPQFTSEDTALVFSTAGGNLISISDVDAAGNPLQITLTAANGTISLSQLTGLSFTTGDGVGDAVMTFTGTLADLNAALDGLNFAPTANFNGAAGLQITTNDQGNTGVGGALSDSDTINITVNAVNDAPVNTVPGPQTTNEDTALVFSTAGGNLISVGDVDAAGNPLQVTLTATNGTISLSGLSGLSFIAGDGVADATMTFTGTLADLNAALDGLNFAPTADFNGAATIQIVTNDQGSTGSGGPQSDIDTVNITVNAVNDAPVNSVPGPQTTNEDTALVFSNAGGNRISISDVDAAGNPLQLTLTATNGTISLGQLIGLSFTAGDGVADAVMTFTGTLADLNAALDGLSFAPTANFNGVAGLQITTSDQGNTGAGGPLSDSDTVNITVNAVNDAPINSVPGPQFTSEDTALVFSTVGGNLISIGDVDAASNPLQVTLTATNGTITLSQTSGLSFIVGSGAGDAVMTFTGTLADLNAALDGLSFAPTADFNGAANLQIVTSDQGNTGAGGPLSDTNTVNITINAVNDAPVNSVPGAQTTNEDTALVFSTAGGNLISIGDVDAASNPLQVTLTATNGTISLSQTTGLSFTAGDGVADATMTFTGTLADLNAALDGLNFAPTADFNGAASLQIVTSDQGNTGAGGPLSDSDTINITVNAVNDAPVNSVPGLQVTSEDTALVFSSAGGNLISVGDVDAAGSPLEVTLTATNGTISLSQLIGLSFTAGDGVADATMTFTGTLADLNAALDGLSFLSAVNFNGADSLQITTNDQGNTGSGGPQSDSDTINITVNAVNDAPINSVPGPQFTSEDTALVFSTAGGNLISVGDVDAAGNPLQVTLTATNGTITLSQTSGLSFIVGSGAGDAVMTFTGTLADLNAALDGLSFAPTPTSTAQRAFKS